MACLEREQRFQRARASVLSSINSIEAATRRRRPFDAHVSRRRLDRRQPHGKRRAAAVASLSRSCSLVKLDQAAHEREPMPSLPLRCSSPCA